MRPAIIFDDGLGQLAPLTDLRPAFDLRTGALTTLERLRRMFGLEIVALMVPESVAPIARQLHSIPVNTEVDGLAGPVLFLNGRSTLPPDDPRQLGEGRALKDPSTGDLVALCTSADDANYRLRSHEDRLGLSGSVHTQSAGRSSLIDRPWHVRRDRDACLAVDLDLLAAAGEYDPAPADTTVIGAANRAKIHPAARIYPTAVLDTEPGTIVIDEHATVRPGAVITGPAYIGPHSTVLDRAVIRSNTVIGPSCKVAGEVSGTIFQGYANKAHDGFLGDSYVGEWANLGAGTTNSNLLNTYGEVLARATPGSSIERTGETFLGCIIGDHAKFAICTRIMTGSVVHTGAMWAATAPVSGCVAPFAWVTDAGAKRYRFDKFAEVAKAVMARRKVTPSEAYLARLAELHRAVPTGAGPGQ